MVSSIMHFREPVIPCGREGSGSRFRLDILYYRGGVIMCTNAHFSTARDCEGPQNVFL